jgi:diguanylate cyclase (GGDEF)-like protein/PAS domain S-box-containing protein
MRESVTHRPSRRGMKDSLGEGREYQTQRGSDRERKASRDTLLDPPIDVKHPPNERKLEHLAAGFSADMLTVHSCDGYCLYASEETSRLLGREPGMVLGHKLQDFIKDDDIAKVNEELNTMASDEVTRMRYRLVLADGSTRWVETRIRKSRGYLIAATRDIDSELTRQASEWSRLKVEARTDWLTRLQNRFGVEEVLEREFDRFLRTGHEFSIAMFDVDRFKDINDTHGHRVGDQVLTRVGALIGQACRSYDVLGRWGGDEFLLVLPETRLDEARSVAARMIATVAGEYIETGASHSLTLSGGVAESQDCATVGAMIDRVDRAMYHAKTTGGNRICIYEMAPAPA